MKTNRQTVILQLINEKDIGTQNQMMEELKALGVHSTQATLSRDIKELRLVKELKPDGTYRYVPAGREESGDAPARLRKIFRECVVGVDTAQNLIVVRTMPGLANAAASAVDTMNIQGLVGTLAGDDTAFFAMKTSSDALEFCRKIEAML